MANAVKGEALLSTSIGDFTLRFDFDAFCQAEEAAGRSFSELLEELSTGKARLGTTRALLWGGFHGHHPEVTLAQVGELLLSDGPALAAAMQKGLTSAFPQAAEKEKAANPPKPRRGTGTRS